MTCIGNIMKNCLAWPLVSNHTGKLKKMHDFIVYVHWSMNEHVVLKIHFAKKIWTHSLCVSNIFIYNFVFFLQSPWWHFSEVRTHALRDITRCCPPWTQCWLSLQKLDMDWPCFQQRRICPWARHSPIYFCDLPWVLLHFDTLSLNTLKLVGIMFRWDVKMRPRNGERHNSP